MKRFLKQFYIGFICIVFAVTFMSCKTDTHDNNDGFKIVTSFYPVYITALNIAGDADNVSITNLTSYDAGCLHDYQLTTADIKTLKNADAFISSGAGMEDFLGKVTEQCPDLKVINAGENIEVVDNNTHTWLSVDNYIKYVENITNGLISADPQNSGKYSSNCEKYISRLSGLKDEIQDKLSSLSSRNIVSFSDAFSYFAGEFDLEILASLELEHDETASAKDVTGIINIVKQNSCKVLLAEPGYTNSAIDTISNETGVPVYIFDPVTVMIYDSNDAYILAMQKNADTLKEALK